LIKKNKLTLKLICCLILVLCIGCSKIGDEIVKEYTQTSENLVDFYGELEVKGNKIYGSKLGKPVQVMGMSLYWSNTGWGQEKWWNKSTIDKMVDDFKIQIVRAAMGVNHYGGYLAEKEGYVDQKAENFNRVKTIIEAAIAGNIYVIVDWHSHEAENQTKEAKEFFSEIAKLYGSYDNVIFEIYNEPIEADWTTIKNYAEEIIPVIREYSDNLIIVGTPKWSQDVDIAGKNPITLSKNIAYTLHFYAGTHKKWLRDKADIALQNGIALFITEWGTVSCDLDSNNYFDEKSSNEWLEWMDKNKLSGCNWSIGDKPEVSSIWYSNTQNLTNTGIYLKNRLGIYHEKQKLY